MSDPEIEKPVYRPKPAPSPHRPAPATETSPTIGEVFACHATAYRRLVNRLNEDYQIHSALQVQQLLTVLDDVTDHLGDHGLLEYSAEVLEE